MTASGLTSASSTLLSFEAYLRSIATHAGQLHAHAAAAGLDAAVPTCPGWDVAALVIHLGAVHRWAVANLRGDGENEIEDFETEGRSAPDLLGWLTEGASQLLETLRRTPVDVQALVFLKNAPAARLFWARRQAHEIAVHTVDVQAARLGRVPEAAETGIATELAADGVDELLRGFVPREKYRLRSEDPYVIAVHATDVGRHWQVAVSTDPVVVTAEASTSPAAQLAGSAVELYLSLWNRSGRLSAEGRPGVLEQWRAQMRVG